MREIFDVILTLESSVQLLAVGPRWVRHRPTWLKRLEVPSTPHATAPNPAKPSVNSEGSKDAMAVDLPVPATSPSPSPTPSSIDLPEVKADPSILPPSHAIAAMVLEFQTALHKRVEDSNCIVCGSGDSKRANQVLLCDGCDVGYHMLCHTPQLSRIPAGKWYCHKCVQTIGESVLEAEPDENVRRSSRKRNVPKKVIEDSDSDEETKVLKRAGTVTSNASASAKKIRRLPDDESSFSEKEDEKPIQNEDSASSGSSEGEEDSSNSEGSTGSSSAPPPSKRPARAQPDRSLRERKRAVSPPRQRFTRGAKKGRSD